jgi:4-amino-4-deoxychorismate lyase
MLVNGQHQNLLPVADRAVQYGDGAFETILVRGHQPVLWQQHLERLRATCQTLQIPADLSSLRAEADALIATHGASGVLKIIISRGAGGRGYAPPESPSPTRIVQINPLPQDYPQHAREGIHAFKCRHPLSSNPALAGLKHLNRLDQVMASLELPAQFQEGLMCNAAGDLIEGIKSNVFMVIDGVLLTPDLSHCGVAGVMRAAIIAQCKAHASLSVAERKLDLEDLESASEVFVCNSVMGIWPITQIRWNQAVLSYEIGALTRRLQSLLAEDEAR